MESVCSERVTGDVRSTDEEQTTPAAAAAAARETQDLSPLGGFL